MAVVAEQVETERRHLLTQLVGHHLMLPDAHFEAPRQQIPGLRYSSADRHGPDPDERGIMDLEGTTVLVTGGSGDIDVSSQAVLGRAASAHDIAAQVVTLCRAESVTKQVLVVDGALPGAMQ